MTINAEVHLENHSEVLRLYDVSEELFKSMAVAFLNMNKLDTNIWNTSQIVMPEEGEAGSSFEAFKSAGTGTIAEQESLQVQIVYS